NDPAQGDPGLWPLVTKKSLGRAFIPGKGWLQIGPRGPIDSGRGQVVGRVTPQEEMRARERARRYSAQTSAYAAQQRLANQYRARLISEISELNDMVEGLRR
ncbi:MAG TPA: hypothetical protein VD994_02920, partial [Prosthecobacter sp.]|nr:hypothetical protein [Prosthecobacter sp.]